MTVHLKTLFVIADGAHARWVRRSQQASDAFATAREMKAKPLEQGHPLGAVFESSSGQRFSVQEGDEAVHRHHQAFAREVAEEINAEVAKGAIERLALVAPSHTLSALTEHLSAAAKAKLTGTLAKDLVKTPDHELGAWLRSLELG
jgi:protein required for attachment to host cells